jgi:TolB-like protein/Tfp pilus assembly protein PilF
MIYQFSNCELDAASHELRVGGAAHTIEPQVFDLLLYLIENRDRMVTKDELFEHVWEGRIVSEANLSNRIGLARQAVGDDGQKQVLIKTFARRGFRFVGQVEERTAELPSDAADVTNGLRSDKPSIAVLPFDNLSADPAQEYFSDGITGDIITSLSRIRDLLVTARNTTFALKGQALDVQSVAKKLGVRYVLEGSVRKAGNRVRISVDLIDGDSGNQLWAERYDRDLEDIFAVQDEITRTVVGALQPELTRSEIDRARRKPPDDLDVWDLYQRGLWHFYRVKKEDNAAAIALFTRAIELDPDFARPYAALSECYANDGFYRFTNRDPMETFEPARKAVETDPQDASAHRAFGWAYLLNQDTTSAAAELKTAISLNPSEAQSHAFLGLAQSYSGRAEEGVENFRLAMQLSPNDPLSGLFHAGLAVTLICLNRHEESAEWARTSLQFPNAPTFVRVHIISALAHAGHMDEARRALADFLELEPDCTIAFMDQRLPFTNDAYRDHYFDGLRKAGMPEG